MIYSPLAVLLRSIAQKCVQLLGLQTEAQFLAWLEVSLPENAGANLAVESRVPIDQLGDSLDELDRIHSRGDRRARAADH